MSLILLNIMVIVGDSYSVEVAAGVARTVRDQLPDF